MLSLMNLLFPRRCPVCGDIVLPEGALICPSCIPKLSPVRQPSCKKCGKEVFSDHTEYCPDCMRRRRSFESGVALLNYNEAARRSMAAVKYKNRREYLDFYAEAIAHRYGKWIASLNADALIPVPVHPARLRKRGFNQAEELAVRLGRLTGIPVISDLLIRTRRTAPQKELGPAERLKNLQQAFAVSAVYQVSAHQVSARQVSAHRVSEHQASAHQAHGYQAPGYRTSGHREIPSCVILVDDIYTTGSTVEACTRILKQSGVERVYFVTVCIGNAT